MKQMLFKAKSENIDNLVNNTVGVVGSLDTKYLLHSKIEFRSLCGKTYSFISNHVKSFFYEINFCKQIAPNKPPFLYERLLTRLSHS